MSTTTKGGTTAIRSTRFNGKVKWTDPDFARFCREVAETNSAETNRLKRNLVRAIREELTPRQQQVLLMCYGDKLKLCEVAESLGVCPSTVTRTLQRAEAKLRRCLQYGATSYLLSKYGDDHED